jgi:hypothetical protein
MMNADQDNTQPVNSVSSREITFDGQKLSIILIALIIPFFIGGEKLFDLIWKGEPRLLQVIVPTWMKYAAVLVAIVLHELIHGLVFARYAANGFKAVKFGASLKMGTVYCHCRDPMKVKYYRRAGIAPTIILGLIPLTFAMITGVHWINTFGLLMTIAGFGDLLIWVRLLKFDSNLVIRDHPEKLGFIIE